MAEKGKRTITAKLRFETEGDKEKVLSLMKRFSWGTRFAYNRLLEGADVPALKKTLQPMLGINSRYAADAILEAQGVLESAKGLGRNPRKVVFGGRDLFERLKKAKGKERQALKEEWREKRDGHLLSRGDRSKGGNPNTRLVLEGGELKLRINVGPREYVYARVLRGQRTRGGRYLYQIEPLLDAMLSGEPYSVRLGLKGGKVYAHFTLTETYPRTKFFRDHGAIGLDLNAYPRNISWAEVDESGQLVGYGRINLDKLEVGSEGERELQRWLYAHSVIRLAKEKGKALVVERLSFRDRGRRGDLSGRKSRRIRHYFGYRSLLEKIKLLARRNGIELVEVNPAYTSLIGMLKYAPQFMVSKDVAAAYVIARRGLGFGEDIPKNYQEIINNLTPETLAELREHVEKSVKNPYLKGKHLRDIQALLSALPSSPERKPGRVSGPLGNKPRYPFNPWQALRVAVVTPLSPDRVLRDMSTLKSLLVSGYVGRTSSGGASPCSWTGTAVQGGLVPLVKGDTFAQIG